MDTKSGYKTTEFWAMLVPYAIIALQTFLGVNLEQEVVINGILAVIGAVQFGAYIYTRFQLKK